MKNRRSRQSEGSLPVKVSYVSLHGAEARLAQAVDLLLKSPVMNDTECQGNATSRKEQPSVQSTAKDEPTNGESAPLGNQGKQCQKIGVSNGKGLSGGQRSDKAGKGHY